jgi:CHAT domain-containing protein
MIMDEQRQEAYLNLINTLLDCINNEEINRVLNANQDLIDPGLGQVMGQVAKILTERGDENAAHFFIDIARQLSEASGWSSSTFTSSKASVFNSQQDLILQVLELTKERQLRRNVVYYLLRENLDKLDKKFAELFRVCGLVMFSQAEEKHSINIAKNLRILSNFICDFPLGSKSNNQEIALNGYEVVETIFNSQEYPEEWAVTQNSLGIVYLDRILGERAQNLERAINCYQASLQVFTREAFPQDWAGTQNNLGEAYRDRIFGEQAQNLEQAINCYQSALEVFSEGKFPQYSAMAQNNLGIAYYNRILGERSRNLEKAIQAYEIALQVYTFEAYPQDWAMAQLNLGNAYCERILGEKAQNLEQGIQCYQAALQVYTRHRFPQYWSLIQNSLGIAYKNRILGEQTQNLEQAIQCYKAALSVRTRDAFPNDWAQTKQNLGNSYRVRIQGDKSENLKNAIHAYQAALSMRTREANPQAYAQTKFNLGFAYQESKQFIESHTNFANAIETIEFFRDQIVSSSDIEESKQKLAEKYNQIYQRMVEVCLQLNFYTEAVEYVERSKTRNLVELILTRDRHTIFPAEVVAQLDRLRDEIARCQYELQNATAEDPTALAQHLQQLRQQRNELQDRYLPIGSGFQFEQFRSTLSNRTAIVEFYIVTDTLLVFIITKYTQEPILLSPDLINLQKLANWANSYLKAYSYKKSHWQRRLTTRLHLLAKILHIDEIIQRIPTECDKLILIPHRYLHLLPLHALPLVGGSSLFDRFSGGVSYAPSCQLLQLAQNRQRPEFTRLFAVQNPTGDLSYTSIEVENIQSYFNTSNLLKQKTATKEAIDKISFTAVHCAHFSCHGYFNGSEPRKSALILANAELNSAPTQSDPENYLSLEKGGVLDLNKCLTLDSIFTLNLEQCRLVTLSACETGLIDFQNTSDEYIGLPGGFLYVGASNVISSLWTVNDLSTAFLMIKFYQNLQDFQTYPTVALALNKAQTWLRDATKKELHGWINELPDPVSRRELLKWIRPIKAETKPFDSPHYWAAFCAIGQ